MFPGQPYDTGELQFDGLVAQEPLRFLVKVELSQTGPSGSDLLPCPSSNEGAFCPCTFEQHGQSEWMPIKHRVELTVQERELIHEHPAQEALRRRTRASCQDR